jgi:hypothetical protein
MTETQVNEIQEQGSGSRVALVDLGLNSNAKEQVTHLLQQLPNRSSARYAWGKVRAHLNACHIFVSNECITLRPYITPTYDNPHFDQVQRRIYLSATLGDLEDLRRAYAVERIEAIRSAKEHDGRRYVFVPGLLLGDDEIGQMLRKLWARLTPKRAVAITPSFLTMQRLLTQLHNAFGSAQSTILEAADIEESLSPFTGAENTVLAVANRYDGLDLPDDDCRLLLLSESPRATNELETNLSSAWKFGPALRWREATRLVQGMGRCTRNATDFAVILLLGESLINSATNPALLTLLSPTLRSEIQWGKAQLDEFGRDPELFAEALIGLIEDADYRSDAEESLAQAMLSAGASTEERGVGVGIAAKEVAHSQALWAGDYTRATELACEIADKLAGPEWSGLRAWWNYCASLAARHAENTSAEIAALRRAKQTGVNSGWLDHVLRMRQSATGEEEAATGELPSVVAESIWNTLDSLGWAGKRFHEFAQGMITNLEAVKDHVKYHQGLEALGRLLGAAASRPTDQGDPDVIWKLGDHVWVCLEAKSEKAPEGTGISKSDVLEAKGHVDWVRFWKAKDKPDVEIVACMVAPSSKLHRVAQPHAESLFYLNTDTVLDWGKRTQRGLLELRTKYAGHDFASARAAFISDLERLSLDVGATLDQVRAETL